MKTIKALSIALSLLMAADAYVITRATAARVPVKPLTTSDSLVTQAQTSEDWRRRRGGQMRRDGGDMRRQRDMRRGGEYRRQQARPGRDYVQRNRDVRRYSRNDRQWRYERNRHGDRSRNRRGNYRHYHNGFWYASPFWLDLSPYSYGYGYGAYPLYSNAWLEWCTRRYRTFNPRTGMYYTGSRWKLCRPY